MEGTMTLERAARRKRFASATMGSLALAFAAIAANAYAQNQAIATAPPLAATLPAAAVSAPSAITISASKPEAADTMAPGTTITPQNWNQYQRFMPDGMAALFQGTYFWKMPADAQINVGPTIIHPLPKNYMAATEKYSSQVKIVELANGGLTLSGYQGGIPFPAPDEPHKGWKVLANLWYRYLPHLIVDTYAHGCLVTGGGTVNCKTAQIISRQLAYNTDPDTPTTIPGAEGKFATEYLMVQEPEQERYTAFLTIAYADPSRAEDTYLFLPSLRRYQPVSSASGCSPSQGTDSTQEDYRFGYNSNITEAQVEFVGEKKILALLNADLPDGEFPQNFDMPLGWPTPSWGKWQVRDVDVISVAKIPSRAAGYCYGKRVMYVDKATWAPVWEDLYDRQMQPWRFFALFLRTVDVPGVGPVDASGSMVWAFWDVQFNHATFFIDPGAGHQLYVNEQAPEEFNDLPRYTSAPGLNLIMR
jgi:Protein of unknown function (DUF1329)